MANRYLVDDVDDWLPAVDGERVVLPAPDCPFSVVLRAEVDVGVLPGVSLGIRLGVFESEKEHRVLKTGMMDNF